MMVFFSHIALVAAAQGIFLSIALFFLQRGNRRANQLLAVFILCFSLWVIEFATYFTTYLYQFPHFLFVTIGFPFLFGPLLLFYAKALYQDAPLKNRWNYLHFIPYLLHLVYLAPFLLGTTADKIAEIEQLQNTLHPPTFSTSFYLNEGLKFVLLSSYLGYIYQLYTKWKKEIKPRLKRYQFNWLRLLLIGLSLFVIVDLAHLLGMYFFRYDYLFDIAKGVLLLGAFAIYSMGYATLRQPEIFAGELAPIHTADRYKKSAFDKSKVNIYTQQLLQKMETEKLYLNHELKLKDVAQSLQLSTHHLSQLLNEFMGKSYFDFVNEYRVKTAQALLINPNYQHYTILSIAHDAGFKTKASFNTAFKKFTGMTPSQYKKQTLV